MKIAITAEKTNAGYVCFSAMSLLSYPVREGFVNKYIHLQNMHIKSKELKKKIEN